MVKPEDYCISFTEKADFFKNVLNQMQIGIVLVDLQGKLFYVNKKWIEFTKLEEKKILGKDFSKIIPHTRLGIVAKTGKTELNQPHRFREKVFLVQRIPIKQDGNIVAVLGILLFDSGEVVSKLAENLLSLEARLHIYEKELNALRASRYTIESIVGVSASIRRCKAQAIKAASTNLPVMITGESGTGKEIFAQAIHNASPRNFFSFVTLNCSAIPKDLIESELFGYEKGAFTGASSRGKPGKFELADRGSIFLDEIGDLPMEMQPKLLRVLQEKEVERIGGNTPFKTDFRLITASNQKLTEMVELQHFRKDLFYRLNVIPINIPPLRERRDDIVPLAQHLIKQISLNNGTLEPNLTPRAAKILKNYDWPGNVRELWNLLAMILSSFDGPTINVSDLPDQITKTSKGFQCGVRQAPLYKAQLTAEITVILDALKKTNNNKTLASKLLGIHRSVLYKKMRKYHLSFGEPPN